MQLDTMARHIEGTTPGMFRQVALAFLKVRGYHFPQITDGPHDGGSDIKICTLPPNRTEIAVQVSVEKDWKGKIEEDAAKIKNKLRLKRLHFVSSRRIPEATFSPVQQSILKKYDVDVTRFDNQAIASTFYLENSIDDLLKALELSTTEPAAPSADLHRDAAYAYLFFGSDTRTFRESFLDSAIKVFCYTRPAGISRDLLIKDVATRAGIENSAENKVRSAVDRLIQSGALQVSNKTKLIVLSDRDRSGLAAQTAMQEKERVNLLDKLKAFFERNITSKKPDPQKLAASIVDDIGALAINNASLSVEVNIERINSHQRSAALRSQCQERMRHLSTTLEDAGLVDEKLRETAILELGKIVSSSSYTKDLMACELFVALAKSQKEQLANALGANAAIEVIVDSSVAIPILCCRLHGHTEQRYFSAANRLFIQAQEKHLNWFLPEDYLEEVAAHLHLAWQNYQAIAEKVSDLSASENAFVAHYAGVSTENKGLSFSEYLEAFGLDATLRTADQRVAINALQPKLARLFARYGMPSDRLHAGAAARKSAEEAVSQAIHQLGLSRPGVVISHDVTTVAALSEATRDASKAYIWCSWDSLCFWLHQYQQPDWIALDPSVLNDLLEVVRGEYSDAALSAPIEYAYMVSSQSAELGAKIWDTLARLENANLSDAKLLKEAKAFKKEFLANRKQGIARNEIGGAWVEWKKARKIGESGH